MEFSPMFYIKNYKYWVRNQIRYKIAVVSIIVIIVLTAYYVIAGFDSGSATKDTSSDSDIKQAQIDEQPNIDSTQSSTEVSQTQYENMIYKGGTLPLPFPEDDVVLTSPFNPYRKHPISGAIRAHKGIDIVGKKATQILAVADGKVTVSGFDKAGYGNWVEIQHNIDGKIIFTRYAHMRDTPLVKAGQYVTAGTVIGIQGKTGGATGEHLHFEVRINGEAINPLPYLLGKETITTYQKW
ncbi:MAG: M23 family metallopeptidase [Clostridia bacterium]|nr:M23 family metallopeptidase [Clostridia bacterium]